MSTSFLDKAYVSPVDKFLYTFDAAHEKTASQLKEIKKHRRIAALRDTPRKDGDVPILWDKF